MTMPTIGNDSIRRIRDALRDLHKALLDVERVEYERSFGRIGSDFYLLQLAAEDPQFAWLRALSSVMMDIDSRVIGQQSVSMSASASEMRLLATRIRALLLSGTMPTPFQQRYQQVLQDHPPVIMAHSAVMRLLPPEPPIRIFTSVIPVDTQTRGNVRVQGHHPGELIPGHGDHGYGPLALMTESFIPSGTLLPRQEHRNDEIVFWVPQGVVHHDDPLRGNISINASNLLVMNTGHALAHTEQTLENDPPTRMLQVYVRPDAINLEPATQYGSLPSVLANTWRRMVGPQGGDAPFMVRNEIEMYDIRLDQDAKGYLPRRDGWHAYTVVHSGEVEIDGVPFGESTHALIQSHRPVPIRALMSSMVVVVLVDPGATVTRAGTTGR